MWLQWTDEFDAVQTAWLLVASVLVLLTLLPASVILFPQSPRRGQAGLKPETGFLAVIVHAALWMLCLQSLVFGPSAGTIPESDGTVQPMQTMEAMIIESAQIVDQRPMFGRGGFIGDLKLAMFSNLEAQGNAEKPLFAQLRSHPGVPASAYLLFSLTVYLVSVSVMIRVTMKYGRAAERSFLFSVIWAVLVYSPVAHWIWGTGWLATRGALDTGGSLFLLVMGSSLFAVVCFSGTRCENQSADVTESPDSPWTSPMIQMIATGLFTVGMVVVMITLRTPPFPMKALLSFNASAAAAAGAVTWSGLRLLRSGTLVGSNPVAGCVSGVTAVAAGAALYDPTTAMLCGGTGAAIAAASVRMIRKHPSAAQLNVPVCLVSAGSFGVILVGLLGSSSNGYRHWDGSMILSLIHGSPALLREQGFAVVAGTVYPFAITSVLAIITRRSEKQNTPESH